MVRFEIVKKLNILKNKSCMYTYYDCDIIEYYERYLDVPFHHWVQSQCLRVDDTHSSTSYDTPLTADTHNLFDRLTYLHLYN